MNTEPTTRNAVIEYTMLGIEDDGIFSCSIGLNYGGAGQAFGGYAMDKHNGKRGEDSRRVGTAYGCEYIKRILSTLEVTSWEKLKGAHLRVLSDHGKVYAIGHILKDQWFNPETDLAEFVSSS